MYDQFINNSDMEVLEVTILEKPLTLVNVPGCESLWQCPKRAACGVYLWTIECDGAFLVNYVGITTSRKGFEGRIWTELTDWRKGKYWTPVDIEAYKRGKRVVVADARLEQLRRQIDAFESMYRILLAPLDPSSCLQAESMLLEKLAAAPGTYQFLANGDKNWKRKRNPQLQLVVRSQLPIIGLTAPIPQYLG